MDRINFSANSNNKLVGTFIPTIRPHSNYYREGRDYEICLKGRFIFIAVIQDIETKPLKDFSRADICICTGYGYDESLEMLRRMAKAATIDEILKNDYDKILLKSYKNEHRRITELKNITVSA